MEIPNLIALNPDKFIEFFTTTRLRMPKHFIFPASLPMDSIKQSSESLLSLTKQVLKTREHTIHELLNECIHITPTPVVDGKYHIFLPASRLTQVMQYASKGIADALERNGHHVELIIEANEMEQIETYHILSAVKELNPHITISINHLNNAYISPNVFNIVWWQDPMPSLVDPNSKFEWRPRDLPYASSNGLANLVSQKGATNVKIQPFCVDQTIFNYNSSNERSEKVVFVGSSNSVQLNRFPPAIVDEIINRIEPAIDQSGVLDLETQLITEFKSRINIAEQEFSFIISYLIRNISVRWLCQCDSIEVEIYGRHWQDNPIVSPFFKRELQHGSELASIYNSAKYAFVPTQPMDINTQRLAEAAACGCIPILTDRRKHSAKPHWDDHCLFFNKKAELSQCFTKIPKRPAHEIADFFSYEHFANEIIQSVNNFEIENKLEGIIAS
ncbi:MAG: glycosyltransferase [Gammaproteobacteria bacterium]|nr:glycosyltransferase [Gammaproteobacteria bacterium]